MLRCYDCGTTIKLKDTKQGEIIDCPECGMELKVIGFEMSTLHLGLSEE